MFQMLNQLFAALATLFMSGEKAASALLNLTEWANESSASFVDEARIKRFSARQQMLKDLGITQAEFDATTTVVAQAAVKPKVKALATAASASTVTP